MRALLAPILGFILLSGCAAPIQATRDLPQPTSLNSVNALLDGKRVDIELVDGVRIEWARDAVVSETELRYTIPAPGPQPGRIERVLDIREVARVTYVRNRGTTWGARVGAVPGLAQVGLGALLIASDVGECDDCTFDGFGVLLGGLAVASGLVIAGAGASVGGFVGSHVSPGGIVPLYEAPVERYLAPPPLMEPTDR